MHYKDEDSSDLAPGWTACHRGSLRHNLRRGQEHTCARATLRLLSEAKNCMYRLGWWLACKDTFHTAAFKSFAKNMFLPDVMDSGPGTGADAT